MRRYVRCPDLRPRVEDAAMSLARAMAEFENNPPDTESAQSVEQLIRQALSSLGWLRSER